MIACGGRSSHDTQPAKDAGSKPAFIDVACGETTACALRNDGEAVCWGSSFGPPSPGPFVAIAASGTYACALRSDGTIACWGSTFPILPAGQYAAISAELDGLLCGLTVDGLAVCRLSYPAAGTSVVTLEGKFSSIATGESEACGISTAGRAICTTTTGVADPSWQDPPTDATFEQLACGNNFCCGISAASEIQCWGDQTPNGERDAPTGKFSAVAASVLWPCAQRSDGTLQCWGKGWQSTIDLPQGALGKFCVGYSFGCGTRTDGTLTCWGLSTDGVGSPPNP
jgi:alpha-tubulin suppressor-like RCC1 family protein